MGGPDKIKRQHDGGKLTVRERIERLLDPGSFHEIGAIAGKAEYDAQGRLADFTTSNFAAAAQQGALAVPHRRAFRRRGDHRPARHAAAALRVRRPCCTDAQARSTQLRLPAVKRRR
jgi:hypothetical protein